MKILIKNGTIVDGTGTNQFKADILVDGDEIVEIGKGLREEGAEIIDASGRIVCPGFIDIHNHADLTILDLPTLDSYIMQGTTTIVSGMCGFGIAPSNEIVKKYYYNIAGRLLSCKPNLCEDVKCFLEKLEEKGISINIAYMIPQGNIRALIFGAGEQIANKEQIQQMQEEIRKNMEAGAFGMTTGLVYPPGSVTETSEIIELAKVVAEYDGIYMSHMRNEGSKIIEIGMNELIRIAKESKCRAHISHWSVISSTTEELTPRIIKVIEDAREKGLEITADITTYPDAVTPLAFIIFNTWVFENYEKNLTNPITRKKIKEEIFQKVFLMFFSDAPLFIRIIPKFLLKKLIIPILTKKVSILSCPNNTEIQGKVIYDVLKENYPNTKLLDAFLDLLRDEEGGIIITLVTKNEEKGMIPLFKQPYVAASSDGIVVVNPEQNEHPRNYGTFPRVIQRWVREKGYISLELAIKKITSLPAEIMRIKDRGVLKKGYKADIVIFNYESIKERGTLVQGRQFPEGIDYVIVNGQITAKYGKHLGTLAGRPLKHKK
ncbi:MAG: N-acyl-D-amino-acid deacylase family protein [Promethearchaeota archaeon]